MIKKIAPILIGLLAFNLVLAQETATSSLPGYISNVFTWSLRIGGLIAFGALVFGGFKYLTSAGSSQAIDQAKNYITGALIGLVILLGAFILLRTINPALVGRKTSWVKPDHGVCFYTQGGAEGKPSCFSGNSKTMPLEAESVEFESSKKDLEGLYWFPEEDWKGGYEYARNEEGSSTVVSVDNPQSFYLDWNTPGVYFYKNTDLEPDFPRDPFKVITNDASGLGNYKGKIKSVDFKNQGCHYVERTELSGLSGPFETYLYGIPEFGPAAVLHTKTNFKGECSIVGTDVSFSSMSLDESLSFGEPGGGEYRDYCFQGRLVEDLGEENVGHRTKSATVFNYSFIEKETGKVTFYEKINHTGDSFTVDANEIGDFWQENISYGSGKSEELEQILSMKIQGNFMVVMSTQSELEGKCEVFKSTARTLKGSYIIPRNFPQNKVQTIAIIPLQ